MVTLACGSGAAFAQAEGVMDRPRPDYDAKGLPLGGLRLFPKVDLGIGNDDNVLRQPTATSSMMTSETPSFLLSSDNWSRNALSVYGNLAAQQFQDLSTDNTSDWTLGGNGRLDIQRGSDFSAGGSRAHLHEPRQSPDLPGLASKPTQYDLTHANGMFTYSPYKFGLKIGGTYDHYDYGLTPVRGNGSPIDNSDRNRDEYDLSARVSYSFSPGYAFFAQGDYVEQKFDQTLDRNKQRRDNSGYREDVGLTMQVSRLVQGEFFVGALQQKFHAPFKDLSGLHFGAAINWYASDLLTIHLNASNTLAATTLVGASTNDNKVAGISADYELLPNLLFQTGYTHTDSTFKGVARHDQIDNETVGLTYLINQYMSANAHYTHEARSTNAAGQTYDDNIILGGLTLHL